MGALKLALLAEGVGELALGASSRAPGDPLPNDALGAGHLLVRKMAVSTGLIPEAAVVFVRPLKLHPGRDARGSDLSALPRLRQLTVWPQSKRAPDGSIVLLDDDDRKGIAAELGSQVEAWSHRMVVIAAAPEFEAWLLADHEALQRALNASIDMTSSPDRLGRDEAKRLWTSLRVQHRPDWTHNQAARNVVDALDLERAAKRSGSFRQALEGVKGFTTKLLA